MHCRLCTRFNCAAPFRERLGSWAPARRCWRLRLQLCRPLSGAVSSSAGHQGAIASWCFNCAAPFRERLDTANRRATDGNAVASIVPPPFGSG